MDPLSNRNVNDLFGAVNEHVDYAMNHSGSLLAWTWPPAAAALVFAAEPVNPRVSDGERAAMEQTLSRVADEAAAALQAYPPSVAGPAPNSHPAVAAAGLPRAAHAIVDRAVRATLGPQPSRKRSAYELFVLQYQKEAKRMVADDAAAAEAGVSGAMSTAAALTQNVYKLSAELHAFGGSLTAEARAEAEAQVVSARTAAAAAEDHVEAARSALAAARAVTPRNKLSALWDALMGPRHAAQRGEWEMRALMDERRWLDEERAYAERYGQLYRLYALQSSLCAQHVGAALADIDVSIRAGFALGPAVAAAATHAGALARPPTSMHASASAAANGARTVASAATASGAAAGAPGFGGTTMFQLARS